MISFQEILDTIKLKGKYWIAFTGDSITSCEWVHPNWREIVEYVLKAKLQADWGMRCFNFAYDGATTKDILAKVNDINSIKPDLVILMAGANDSYFGIEVDEHAENIRKIRSSLKSKVVFSTDNKPWNSEAVEKYLPYVEIYRRTDVTGGQFVNLFKISERFPNERIYTFKSEAIPEMNIEEGDLDYWHPNQLGNAYIARVILEEVFGIDFDPERYWKETLAGEKYPKY